jgi:hypothetical protein
MALTKRVRKRKLFSLWDNSITMNIDENDLLYTNNFIPQPELTGEVPPEFNEEFKKYYENELQKQQEQQLKTDVERITLLDSRYDEDTDPANLQMSNGFGGGDAVAGAGVRPSRIQREIKTYVNVDSRDRDLVRFPSANHFSMFLGKTFYNVSSIRLASFEFPNSKNVFNDTNNRIVWRNSYDVENGILDSYTGVYPEYNIRIKNGNYTLTSLQNEIHNKAARVIRDGTKDAAAIFHNFATNIEVSSNTVTLTSLKYTKLALNPFQLLGPYTIRLFFPEHPFRVGDTLHISGGVVGNGVPNTAINGKFIVTVAESNHVQYNTSVQIPLENGSSLGGLNVLCGQEEPFQLLFGENDDTPASSLGFPKQNSSQPIITTLADNGIANTFDIVNQKTTMTITTQETHNFSSGNIGQTIRIHDAPYIPDLNRENKINNVISDTQFVIDGNYNFQYNADTYNYDYRGPGFFYTRDPLKTIAPKITDCVYSPFPGLGRISFNITTETPHYLKSTERVKIWGLKTSPNISPTLEREEGLVGIVSSDYNFTVSFHIGNDGPNTMDVDFSDAVVGTSLLELTFQNHGFNEIVNVSTVGDYTFTTLFPHNIEFKETSFDITTPGTVESGTIEFTSQVEDPDSFTLIRTDIPGQFTFLGSPIQYAISFDGTYRQVVEAIVPLASLTFSYTVNITASTPLGQDIVSIYRNLPGASDDQLVSTFDIPTTSQIGQTISKSYSITNVSSSASNGSYYFVAHTTGVILSVTATGMPTIQSSVGILTTPPVIFYDVGNSNINGIPFGTKSNPLPPQTLPNEYTITIPVNSGGVSLFAAKYKTKTTDFLLYNVQTDKLVDNPINTSNINNRHFNVYKLLTTDKFLFKLGGFYSKSVETFGGDIVYISSALHGFNGAQTNELLAQVNRKIKLDGENYVFLKCPQLATMLNTGKTDDIFARIVLDQYPGSVIFSFLSNPKVFNDAPLNQLDRLDFSIVEHDNKLYNLNDLDYSFVLEITEIQDTIENTNFSSRRGVNIINRSPYVQQGQLTAATGHSGDLSL